MTLANFTTLHTYDTVNSADSVEWCPIPPHRNSFACGTYQLVTDDAADSGDEKSKEYTRMGYVKIFTVHHGKLEVNHTEVCPAVLDMKWCQRKINEKIVLAVANSIGEVVLFYFEEDKTLKLMVTYTLKKEAGDFLALSLDWTKQNCEDLICVSDSKGNVTLLKFSNETLSVLREWNAHQLEAWIVCFDSFNQNILYSGGDEGVLKIWDSRQESSTELFSSRKHSAGVTALCSCLYEEHNLVSGSYDETVLFWDTRNWKRPMNTISASGGLWRLKWESKSRSRYLLAACIYGGFQVYDTKSFTAVSEYKEHESLAYGADWCYLDYTETKDMYGFDQSTLVATCSFYDHKLCVSVWHENTKTQ